MQRLKSLDEHPAELCGRYDRTPAVMPKWPPAPGCALVVVFEDDGGGVAADVVSEEADFAKIVVPERIQRQLFFQLPETVVRMYL